MSTASAEITNNESLSRFQTKDILYCASAILLFGAFAFQLWFHAVRTSATIDEGAHILAGRRHLQWGNFGINPEHPPLLKMLAASPLYFNSLNEPPWKCGSRLTSKLEMFSHGTSFLVQNGIEGALLSCKTRLLPPPSFINERPHVDRPRASPALHSFRLA